MATLIGRVGMVIKGAWDSSIAYDTLDVVTYNNNTYIAKQASPAGTLPTNTTYWQLSLDASLLQTKAEGATKVSGATNGNFAGLDANGNLTDSGKKSYDFAGITSLVYFETTTIATRAYQTGDYIAIAALGNGICRATTNISIGTELVDPTNITFVQLGNEISGKATKVSGATNGNFVSLDANGDLIDSGKKAGDFASSNIKGTDILVGGSQEFSNLNIQQALHSLYSNIVERVATNSGGNTSAELTVNTGEYLLGGLGLYYPVAFYFDPGTSKHFAAPVGTVPPGDVVTVYYYVKTVV